MKKRDSQRKYEIRIELRVREEMKGKRKKMKIDR